MDNSVTIDVDTTQLTKLFQDMIKSMDNATVEQIAMNGAEDMQEAILAKTPGKTGNLKENIITFYLPRIKDYPRAAIVKSTANHDHLVEFGSVPRWQRYTRRFTGAMPARPFFRPTADANKERILRNVINELLASLDRVI